jgi:branched-chain amino acid transport system substrate-binding protein
MIPTCLRPRLAGAALLSLAAGCSVTSATADETVKIGNILSLSGAAVEVGIYLQQGENLYLKLHEKDLPPGVHIQLITRDDQSKPDETRRLAQELIVQDHVQMLAGLSTSPQAFAIAPVITQAKMPTIIMNATTGSLTRSSPYFIRISDSNWQTSYNIGAWAAKNSIKTAYTLVSDYTNGIDMENAFKRGFTDNGGQMLGSDRSPISTTDYLPYMQRIKAAKPQAMFFFEISGAPAEATLKAYANANLREAGIRLVANGDAATDDELPTTGPEADGMVDATLYTTSLDTPTNDAFLKAWRAEYGANSAPSFQAVAAWNGMEAIFAVIRKLGPKATGDEIIAFLKQYHADDAPQGTVAIDPQTRDVVQTVYFAKVQKVDGQWRNVPFDVIKGVKDPWKELNPEK